MSLVLETLDQSREMEIKGVTVKVIKQCSSWNDVFIIRRRIKDMKGYSLLG